MQEDQLITRQLPSDANTERAILGLMLINAQIREECAGALTAPDFYLHRHQIIFSTMVGMEGAEVLPATLADALKMASQLEAVGGHSYLVGLMVGIPSYVRIAPYVTILREKTVKRQAAQLGMEIAQRAIDDDCPASEIIGFGEQALSELRKKTGQESGGFRTFEEVAVDAAEHYERLKRGERTATPTGFGSLDKVARGGIHPGELWVVAALTGKGKSAWAIGAARYMATGGYKVAIVSREMSDLQNFTRAHSPVADVTAWHISEGLRPWDYEKLMNTLPEMAKLPILIDSRTANMFEIRANLRRAKKQDIVAVFVDYLQLLNVRADSAYSSRAQEVAACSRMLKEIAMDLQIGVFALAQFNRIGASESRPEIHHLAESGSIEKDADLVLILDMDDQREDTPERSCRMRIAKHRSGPQMSLDYVYDGNTLTFREVS